MGIKKKTTILSNVQKHIDNFSQKQSPGHSELKESPNNTVTKIKNV